MNARHIKIAAIGVVWTMTFFFAARITAGVLCSNHRTFNDAAGDPVFETNVAAPGVVWSLMLSPIFAFPAVVVLLGGWVLIWYLLDGHPATHGGDVPSP